MTRTKKGGYYRGSKFIAVDWGDKISTAQQSDKYKDSRKREFTCLGCGKHQIGVINQSYCDYDCKYKALGNDPISKKAFTISSVVTFGVGKKVFFEKLVRDSLHKPCRYCGTLLILENISLDHIVPFNELKWRNNPAVKKKLNVPENLQIICKKCNSLKSNLAHEKFIKLLTFMDSDLEIGEYLRRKLGQSNIMWNFKRKSS